MTWDYPHCTRAVALFVLASSEEGNKLNKEAYKRWHRRMTRREIDDAFDVPGLQAVLKHGVWEDLIAKAHHIIAERNL